MEAIHLLLSSFLLMAYLVCGANAPPRFFAFLFTILLLLCVNDFLYFVLREDKILTVCLQTAADFLHTY